MHTDLVQDQLLLDWRSVLQSLDLCERETETPVLLAHPSGVQGIGREPGRVSVVGEAGHPMDYQCELWSLPSRVHTSASMFPSLKWGYL